MMSLMMLLALFEQQLVAPCGTKFNPCWYKSADIADAQTNSMISTKDFENSAWQPSTAISTPSRELEVCTKERAEARSTAYLMTLLGLGGLGVGLFFFLLVLAARHDIFAAWRRAEFAMPRTIKQLLYIFVTPTVVTMTAALMIRFISWMGGFVATAEAYGFFGLMTAGAGFCLGLVAAQDVRK